MDQQSMLQDMNQSRRPKPPQENQPHQPPPPPPPQKCPRCDSLNTKFCYYNNYSQSQPRYFCKGCRRYWTHGGTLRNVPVGGGCRKGKRARSSPPHSVSSPSAAAITSLQQQVMPPLITNFDQTQRDTRGNLGIPSPSSSSSPYFPSGGGGFLSSLAAMNMRSLSPMMMNQPQPQIHHQIGFNSSLGQNQHNSFNQMLVNERETSNMEPMFIHPQQQNQQQGNRGLVPPWALNNHHQNLQIGNPSFWNSNIINTGSSNSTSSSIMSSLGPNQWLNLPGCGGGSGPDSSSSMIDKKP